MSKRRKFGIKPYKNTSVCAEKEKNMKKKLTILLSLICVVALTCAIGACGGGNNNNSNPQPTTYTVTFAGDGVSTPSQKVKDGETATEPRSPEREGYTFDYWYLDDENTVYDFGTPVKSDITLTAHWTQNVSPVDRSQISGEGTKENPYLIQCAEHLNLLAKAVNAGEEKYKEAKIVLDRDVDLGGYGYTPIGTEDNPFKGYFDGQGHKIKNLTLNPTLRSEGIKAYGLFGVTNQAEIKNLTLENVSIDFQSYKDGSTAGAYIGGLVGKLGLSNVTAVTVSGSVSSFTLASNSMYIGGLAGIVYNQNTTAYISYIQNCLVDVNMSIDEEDGEKGDLSNAAVGGIAGMVFNYNCSVAIINNAVYGNVYGGTYTGGIVGYLDDTATIMDCLSAADVEATATDGAYAGGIAGVCSGDAAVIDCISTGNVKAPASTDTNNKSIAGGILGKKVYDDYEIYYTAGTLVSNNYYCGNLTADKTDADGNSSYGANYFNDLAHIFDKVNWNEDCWEKTDRIAPNATTAAQAKASYKLTLKNANQQDVVIEKETDGRASYGLINTLEDPENGNNGLFWAWQTSLDGDSQYRYYVPVIKDMTLYAKWQDVSEITGAYKGTITLYATNDAGSLILESDGTLKMVNTSVITGTYKYNGTYIRLYINNNIGETSGTVANGKITFMVDAGMSGTVTYEFTAYNPAIIGEYINERGDLLTFAGEDKVSFESERYNNGGYFDGKYKIEENGSIALTFSKFSYYSSMKETLGENDKIMLSYVLNGESKTETFTKLGSVDYSDKGFVGEYSYVYLGSSESYNQMRFKFLNDGTAIMISPFSETVGRYYYIESTGILKVIIEGYVSNFTYDKDEEIVYGNFIRGMGTSYRPVVMTRYSRGAQSGYTNYVFSISGEKANPELFIFTVPDGGYYIYKNGIFLKGATVEGNVADGESFVFEGQKYRILTYTICTVGNEEGDYTYGDVQISLDGLSTATVKDSANDKYYYVTYKNSKNLVVILYENDEIVAFDYVAAKTNGGTITKLTPEDNYQGVWYQAYNGNDYYHKFVVDGFGHATIFSTKDDGTYALNWGGTWGTYEVTQFGITVAFNASHQGVEFTFYYDMNLAYTEDYSMDGTYSAFTKRGYTGSKLPPEFPESYVGSYVSGSGENQLVLNIKKDLTGSYKGTPVANVKYDGENKLYFKCNNIDYAFTLTNGGGTLSSVEGQFEFTLAGAITEVIPAAICGRWTGVFSGMGTTDKDKRGFIIESNGTIKYIVSVNKDSLSPTSNVSYDATTLTITFTTAGGDGDVIWTLVYNAEKQTITVDGRDEENRSWTATLTKE